MTRLAILLRTSFLILTLICASQTMARSQKYKVTIKVKEQKLLDVFKSIQQQTNLIVFYSNTILNDQEKVSIQVKDEPLEKVLDQIIAGKALKYEVQEKYIVIAPKEEKKGVKEIKEGASGEDVAPLPPPEIDVVVRVTDEEGNPLVGASVMIRGTKTGAQTNSAGIAIFKGIADNAVLEVSFVGYEQITIPVSKKNAISIELKKKENELQEVVVGKGYYEEKQRFTVGNTVRISGKDIEKQPVDNPLFALQGRVPGLLVTQSNGFANGGFLARIQGQNSLSLNNNSPLIVVDGIPLANNQTYIVLPGPLSAGTSAEERGNNPVGFINPTDIESIDVLKDADATAIYGSRAANGAIIITTKRGKSGKPKVSVGVQQGWSRVARKMDLLNTRQYLDMRYEAIRNDGLSIGTSSSYNDLVLYDTTRYTDWQEVLLGGTASRTSLNASLSGGSSNVQYLIGGTFNRSTTVFPGDFANKSGTIHFNINTASVNQRFKLSLSGNYTLNNNGVPGADLTAAALALVPNAPSLYNPDGSLNWALNASGGATWENPLINSFYRDYEYSSKLLLSNAQVSYTILPGLALKGSLGYNSTHMNAFYGSSSEAVAPANRRNTSRSSSFGNVMLSNWLLEPQLTYNQKLGKGLLDVLAGGTIQKTVTDVQSISASGFSSDLLLKDLASALNITALYRNAEYRYNALFGRINFNWNSRYILNVAARRDGSSRFGVNNQFHNFWSTGAAWIFTEAKALKGLFPILSFGKIRASYGTSGSDGLPDYQYLSQYAATPAGIPYQEVSGLQTFSLENPYVHWEEVRKLQGGIDLGFFNDRVLLNATYARNRSSDQLISYVLPAITGRTSLYLNFPALIQNTSWEFSLFATPVKTKQLSWISSFNLTLPRNKLLAFPGIENTSYAPGTNSGVIIGQPLGATYYYHYLGVDPLKGQYLFEDNQQNPGSSRSNSAQEVLLSFQPRYYGGWSNTINFQKFSLDFIFQFIRQLGADQSIYMAVDSRIPGTYSSGLGNQPLSVLDRWQKPGDHTAIARYTTAVGAANILSSDAVYSYNASFIRLKKVSLSWQLPPDFLQRMSLQSGTLFFRGQNLATLTRYKGLDPESQGASLPPLQTWTFGFNLSL